MVSDPLSAGLTKAAFQKYESAMKRAARRNVIPGCASVVLKMGEVVPLLSIIGILKLEVL